jgi:hypothetical protein
VYLYYLLCLHIIFPLLLSLLLLFYRHRYVSHHRLSPQCKLNPHYCLFLSIYVLPPKNLHVRWLNPHFWSPKNSHRLDPHFCCLDDPPTSLRGPALGRLPTQPVKGSRREEGHWRHGTATTGTHLGGSWGVGIVFQWRIWINHQQWMEMVVLK